MSFRALRAHFPLLLLTAVTAGCTTPADLQDEDWGSPAGAGKSDSLSAAVAGTWTTDDAALATLALKADNSYLAVTSGDDVAGTWTIDRNTIVLSHNQQRYLYRVEEQGNALVLLAVDEHRRPIEPIVTFAFDRAEVGYCQVTPDCELQPLEHADVPGAWSCEAQACVFEEGDACVEVPGSERAVPMSTLGAPAPREFHSAAWTGSEFIVWGGRGDAGLLGDGARYNPSSDTWAPMSAEGAPSARIQALSFWSGDELYIFGGKAQSWLFDGGAYDPESDSWRTLPSDPLWEATCGDGACSVTWTGTEALFWRHAAFGGVAYDPASGTWSEIPGLSEYPADKEKGALEWTGQDVFVLADDRFERLDRESNTWEERNENRGSRDHIATPGAADALVLFSWRAHSPALIPQIYHAGSNTWRRGKAGPGYVRPIVWTGREVVLCRGAHQGEGYWSLCTRYDPTADTWSSEFEISDARVDLYEEAVWTGDEMIVWGGSRWEVIAGFDISGLTNKGLRYLPPTCE